MPVITVGAIVLREEAGQPRQVLLAKRRSDRRDWAGLWGVPAGRLEEGEEVEEALVRELAEEVGLLAREFEFLETVFAQEPTSGERYVHNLFLVNRWGGKAENRAPDEHETIAWVASAEVASLPMPVHLRDVLLGLLSAPDAGEPPDNRAAWNAVSAAYQARYWQDAPLDRLYWCWGGPSEDELGVLDDVLGKRVLILGCGGGQDCVALVRMGAAEVTGIDLSDEQLRYARELAAREGVSFRLLQGNVEDLSRIDSTSQDMVVSSQALTYMEHVDRCIAEALRVLRPGGSFAFSVHHPFDACLADEAPHSVTKPYWQAQLDWDWEYPEAGVRARCRSWYRTVSDWFRLLTDAGFQVERILEPGPAPQTAWVSVAWAQTDAFDKLKLVPDTLIFKARKPR